MSHCHLEPARTARPSAFVKRSRLIVRHLGLTAICILWSNAYSISAAHGQDFINREYELKAKLIHALAAYIKPEGEAKTPPARRSEPDSRGESLPELTSGPVLKPNSDVIQIAVIGPSKPELMKSSASLTSLGKKKVAWEPFPSGPAKGRNGTMSDIEEFLERKKESWKIIFLTNDQPANVDRKLDRLSEEFPDQPVLIVTDQRDSFRKKAAVNLFVDTAANQLRVQVRKSELERRKLVANPALYKAPGILVYD